MALARSNADYRGNYRLQRLRNTCPHSEQKLADVEEYSNRQDLNDLRRHRANRAWFVEAVLPTGHYADKRANRAWFVEMVLPTGDSKLTTENLKSVAATL